MSRKQAVGAIVLVLVASGMGFYVGTRSASNTAFEEYAAYVTLLGNRVSFLQAQVTLAALHRGDVDKAKEIAAGELILATEAIAITLESPNRATNFLDECAKVQKIDDDIRTQHVMDGLNHGLVTAFETNIARIRQACTRSNTPA